MKCESVSTFATLFGNNTSIASSRRVELQEATAGPRYAAFDTRPKNQRSYLVFMHKALFGYLNVDINNFDSFFSRGRTRSSQSSKKLLRNQRCWTRTFQSSNYNRIVKTWNTLYKETNSDKISTPSPFKHLLKRRYTNLLISSTYDM